MNVVVLIGNLTADPELRQTSNEIAVATFSIAVNRTFTNQQGEKETDFFRIVVWRKQAENCAKYLTKGSKVAVSGRLQNRSYEAQDGQKRSITEVVADSVRFLSPKNSVDKSETEFEIIEDDEDELPF